MRSQNTVLPREGLYIDPLASVAKKTILHPVISLATLSALTFLDYDWPWPSLCKLACYGSFFGLAIWLNDYLTKWSRNNWTVDTKYDWKCEIAVVSGGSGGIGASVVQRLAADGVRVVVLDVIPLTYNIDEEIVTYYRCDLSDEAEIRAICARIQEEVGHPTILVNNAGLVRGQTIAEGSYHDNALTLKTNLLAPFFLTKEFLPNMIKHNHGHIFSVASMSAFVPLRGLQTTLLPKPD
ncbi:hypothetical protein N7494_000484 [Penicillium frequentans]|uniref:Short-chain dehydrogenase/reductase family 16C member 6 n=1 Tax=Penicillium frequentans TaxID=3151616 RepID=A0AAD6D5W4_9EURO|nr:hypothetical protein N7494_000484 [Penicillium glabrum]